MRVMIEGRMEGMRPTVGREENDGYVHKKGHMNMHKQHAHKYSSMHTCKRAYQNKLHQYQVNMQIIIKENLETLKWRQVKVLLEFPYLQYQQFVMKN